MTRTSLEDVIELTRHESGPCVTMYMPASPEAPLVAQNRIRYKNLLGEARRGIAKRFGLGDREEEELLAPAEELLSAHEFWRRRRRGLAFFVGRRFFRHHDTPVPVAERLVVGEHFYVKPLVSVTGEDARYYVLCLSLGDVRVYSCTRHACARVDLPDTPTDLRDVVGYDVDEQHLQWHTGTPGGTRGRPAIFHGQGGGEDDLEPQVRLFLSSVDSGVRRAIPASSPLVLLGLEHQVGMYRKVSRHPSIVGTVGRSPAGLDDAAIHELTWPCIHPIVEDATSRTIDQIASEREAGRATERVEEVVSASLTGRVDALVYSPEMETWGRVDPERVRVEPCEPGARGGRELVDYSIVETLANGGRVHAADQPMLHGAPMAALLRY